MKRTASFRAGIVLPIFFGLASLAGPVDGAGFPARGGFGHLRGAEGGAPPGAGAPAPNRRPPGERMTPEERERLRREIRQQGQDVYGRRPPPPNSGAR